MAYAPFADSLQPLAAGTPAMVKVLSMGTENTANLKMIGLASLPPKHPDIPVLRIIGTYFSMAEGPLWKQIRGLGLAYGFHFGYSPLKGYLTFEAYEATNVIQVFIALKFGNLGISFDDTIEVIFLVFFQ